MKKKMFRERSLQAEAILEKFEKVIKEDVKAKEPEPTIVVPEIEVKKRGRRRSVK